MKYSLLILAFLFISQNLLATTKTWDGSQSTTWKDDANWVNNVAPVPGDSVIIEAGANNCVFDEKVVGYNSAAPVIVKCPPF